MYWLWYSFCNYYKWLSQNHLLFTYCIKNSLCHVNWKLALWVRSSCLFVPTLQCHMHVWPMYVYTGIVLVVYLCFSHMRISAHINWSFVPSSLTSVHSWRTNCQKSSEPTKPFSANKCQAMSEWRLKVSSDRSSWVSLAFAWEAELPNAATLITNWSWVNGIKKYGSAAVLLVNTSSGSSWTNCCSYYYHYRNGH